MTTALSGQMRPQAELPDDRTVGLVMDGACLGRVSLHRLDEALRGCTGLTLAVSGLVTLFTGPVLERLVAWSLAAPGRGFGLSLEPSAGLVPEFRHPVPPRETVDWGAFPVGSSGDEAYACGPLGRRQLTGAEFLARLTGRNPFFAAALTGHGAEHCIALGAAWLSAGPTYGLRGAIYPAGLVTAPLLLLNGCSTLRLADSLVPDDLRLTTLLSLRGVSVAGPFRNIRGSLRLEQAFVELVLAGLPAGRVVREMNALLRDQLDEIPCLVLVGDPGLTLPGAVRSARACLETEVVAARAAARAALERSAGTLRRARDFHAGLSIWNWRLDGLPDALARAELCVRTVGMVLSLEPYAPLPLADLAVIQDEAEEALKALQDRVSDGITAWVRSGRWLQGAYSPVGVAAVHVQRRCEAPGGCRGGGALVDYRFSGPALIDGGVFARECDRCGSRAEWLGRRGPVASPETTPSGSDLLVEMPPLDPGETGRVFVHRCDRTPVCRWPEAGGPVRLELSASPVHGRVTVVALRVGPDSVGTAYTHLFRRSADHPSQGTQEASLA